MDPAQLESVVRLWVGRAAVEMPVERLRHLRPQLPCNRVPCSACHPHVPSSEKRGLEQEARLHRRAFVGLWQPARLHGDQGWLLLRAGDGPAHVIGGDRSCWEGRLGTKVAEPPCGLSPLAATLGPAGQSVTRLTRREFSRDASTDPRPSPRVAGAAPTRSRLEKYLASCQELSVVGRSKAAAHPIFIQQIHRI